MPRLPQGGTLGYARRVAASLLANDKRPAPKPARAGLSWCSVLTGVEKTGQSNGTGQAGWTRAETREPLRISFRSSGARSDGSLSALGLFAVSQGARDDVFLVVFLDLPRPHLLLAVAALLGALSA